MSDLNIEPAITSDEVIRLAPKPVNVAQVRQLSPFRYPGGKTWLVPEIKTWLARFDPPALFVEPFAGGGIVSLTVALEHLADRVVMVELDDDVAAVWLTAFGPSQSDFDWLCSQILTFDMDPERVRTILADNPVDLRRRAFRTILKNRVNRGGILAPGASLVKVGENNKGLRSRWYPETLVRRFHAIRTVRDRVDFYHTDAFHAIDAYHARDDVIWFLDPPYTAGGKRAGSRLYVHNELDHDRLFDAMASAAGNFLMTYDDAPEVFALAQHHHMHVVHVPMKNTHHQVMHELLISRSE